MWTQSFGQAPKPNQSVNPLFATSYGPRNPAKLFSAQIARHEESRKQLEGMISEFLNPAGIACQPSAKMTALRPIESPKQTSAKGSRQTSEVPVHDQKHLKQLTLTAKRDLSTEQLKMEEERKAMLKHIESHVEESKNIKLPPTKAYQQPLEKTTENLSDKPHSQGEFHTKPPKSVEGTGFMVRTKGRVAHVASDKAVETQQKLEQIKKETKIAIEKIYEEAGMELSSDESESLQEESSDLNSMICTCYCNMPKAIVSNDHKTTGSDNAFHTQSGQRAKPEAQTSTICGVPKSQPKSSKKRPVDWNLANYVPIVPQHLSQKSRLDLINADTAAYKVPHDGSGDNSCIIIPLDSPNLSAVISDVCTKVMIESQVSALEEQSRCDPDEQNTRRGKRKKCIPLPHPSFFQIPPPMTSVSNPSVANSHMDSLYSIWSVCAVHGQFV